MPSDCAHYADGRWPVRSSMVRSVVKLVIGIAYQMIVPSWTRPSTHKTRPCRKQSSRRLQFPTVSVRFHLPDIAHRALSRWSSQQRMGRNQQPKGGGYAGNKGNKTYAGGGKSGGGNKKTADAATALGLGLVYRNRTRCFWAWLHWEWCNTVLWTHFSDLWGRTL